MIPRTSASTWSTRSTQRGGSWSRAWVQLVVEPGEERRESEPEPAFFERIPEAGRGGGRGGRGEGRGAKRVVSSVNIEMADE